MKQALSLIAVAFAATFSGIFAGFGFRHRTRRAILANIAEGDHANGVLNFRADAAHSARYLLCKRGSDDQHVAVTAAVDTPLYIATDDPQAAEDPVACKAIAACVGTTKAVTDGSSALAAGDVLVPAAGGKVKKIAVGAGNYYVVGIATAAVAATDGDELEMIPIGAWKTQ